MTMNYLLNLANRKQFLVKFFILKLRFCLMHITSTIDRDEVQQWISNKLSIQRVEELLQAKGLDQEAIIAFKGI
jgi:hypothetical protein